MIFADPILFGIKSGDLNVEGYKNQHSGQI